MAAEEIVDDAQQQIVDNPRRWAVARPTPGDTFCESFRFY
jgi:hypothetical protein